jgi:hypothetical protein
LVIDDDDEIVDAVAFEEVQDFHGEFVLVDGDGISSIQEIHRRRVDTDQSFLLAFNHAVSCA